MKLTLSDFATKELESDFYNVIVQINLQHFIDTVGLQSDADLITVTEKEKKDYVEGVLANNIAATYLSAKTQQEVNAYTLARQEANKDKITPVVPPVKRLSAEEVASEVKQ